MVQKFVVAGIFLLALCCPAVAGDFQRVAPVHLDHDGEKWAQKTLKKLSLEEKVGQMFMIRLAMPQFVNLKNPDYLNWLDQIERYHLGSVLLTVPAEGPSLSKSEPYEAAMLINQLQHAAKIPLLVAADYERGLSMRLNGTTVFPHSMAFGAAAKPEFAEQFGRIVAQESRAIGVQWNLMPIADVNSNPANPVINTRSFGEDPTQVSALVSAYIRGARNNGLLTAAKHFPGHGDTATDSHLGLAAVNRTREQINQIDLPPFRAAIAAGADAVMVAHITAPVLEPDPSRVATNSPAIVTGLLKQQLGFTGLVITDAMDMGGLTSVYPEGGSAAARHAAIDTVRAGNDMLLLFTDLDGAYKGLLNAVRSGEIPEKRIDESVLKILRVKASVGLNKASQVDINELSSVISSPENLAVAQQIADSAVTLVRDNGRMLPLRSQRASASASAYGAVQKEGNKLLCIIFTDDVRSDNGRQLQRELRARLPDSRIIFVDPRIAAGSSPEIQSALDSAENVLAAIYLIPVPGRAVRTEGATGVNTISVPDATAALLQSILQAKREKTVVVSFGSPYFLSDFPQIENYVCAYSNALTSEVGAIKALFGEIPFRGRLPVTIPGIAQRGAGTDQLGQTVRK
ncbi:MAG TPA: glycoside hydrolase family 3 N-terminal domain-containing protein [Candidatus Polarisedimenticolia bacterium]|nr:glycoside hydrolase family 3 N-terminal domain-containing protein [Candidatus Polarisedimenticolia bacterium]